MEGKINYNYNYNVELTKQEIWKVEYINDNDNLRVQLANSSTAVLLLAVIQIVETLIQVTAAAIQKITVVILMTAAAAPVHWTVYMWQLQHIYIKQVDHLLFKTAILVQKIKIFL
jgi:hypothetical protein